MSLIAAVAPHTRKIWKNRRVFERGQNLLQNDVLNFTFRLSQLSGITFEKNPPFEKGLGSERVKPDKYIY